MRRCRTALLIVDVQRGLFRRPTPVYRADELLANINMLVDRAHRAAAPVFYVQHSGKTLLPIGTASVRPRSWHGGTRGSAPRRSH